MMWYLRRLAGFTRRSLALWLFHLSTRGPTGVLDSNFMVNSELGLFDKTG